jgi:hypothetical protein
MNRIQKFNLHFQEASPLYYNSDNNCKFSRPYILDFSPLANIYPPESFADLLNSNSTDSVVTPYSLLIQVALGYLDGAFSLIHTGPGRSRFEDFVRGIFGTVHTRGNIALFLHAQRKREYDLNPGWISALSQGQALSLWLRLKAFGDSFDDLDYIGPLLLNGMLNSIESGGGLYRDRRTDELWLEEYPSIPASHVLNGFIFALFGLMEFNISRDLNEPDEAVSIADKLNQTLLINIDRYNKFGWSCYDLAKRNFAPTRYHIIHIFTLNYLSVMLNNNRLFVVAEQWRKGVGLNDYYLIDILRFFHKIFRKAYVTIAGRRW